jgi:hypothetical protein
MIPRYTGSQTETTGKGTDDEEKGLPNFAPVLLDPDFTRTRVNRRGGCQDAGERFVRDRDAGRASMRDYDLRDYDRGVIHPMAGLFVSPTGNRVACGGGNTSARA